MCNTFFAVRSGTGRDTSRLCGESEYDDLRKHGRTQNRFARPELDVGWDGESSKRPDVLPGLQVQDEDLGGKLIEGFLARYIGGFPIRRNAEVEHLLCFCDRNFSCDVK